MRAQYTECSLTHKSQDSTKNPPALNCCATSFEEARAAGKKMSRSRFEKVILCSVLQRLSLYHSCSQHRSLITNLRENERYWSETPIREKSSEAQNKYDLCWQGFGPTVLWHFCCCSDGKYYIMHGCFSLWRATYQCKGGRQHTIGAQVLLPRREQEICMSCFPFQTSCAASWPTRTPRSQMRKKHAIAKSYSCVIIVVFVLHTGLKQSD